VYLIDRCVWIDWLKRCRTPSTEKLEIWLDKGWARLLPVIVQELLHGARGEREQTIAFSANMEYHPNVSAVRYFARRIWPLLRERWPSLRWDLIGKNPETVRRYTEGDARIRLTGPVEDAIRELARTSVAVVPLLA